MDVLDNIGQAVIRGDQESLLASVREALATNREPNTIMKAMVDAMDTVGEEWRVERMFIPEVLLSAQVMRAGVDILRPHLSAADMKMRGEVVIGTTQGDLHDIGKSLVAMMLEGAGFRVHDLGVDVSPARFVEAVKNHQPDIVGMSALLTTTLSFMRDTILAFEESGLRDSIKIMVGGAPVTQEFADAIGADGYAPDGATAVEKARELVGERT